MRETLFDTGSRVPGSRAGELRRVEPLRCVDPVAQHTAAPDGRGGIGLAAAWRGGLEVVGSSGLGRIC